MSTTSSLKNVRSLLPGPFYDCLVPVFTNSGSLQPRQVVYSSCSMLYGIRLLCGKYTEGFVVCQVFFSSFQICISETYVPSTPCVISMSECRPRCTVIDNSAIGTIRGELIKIFRHENDSVP